MKLLIAGLLALSSFSFSPAIVLASTDVAIACSPNVPEAMKRPGGYCDQIESIDNIGTERDRGPDSKCLDQADLAPLLQRGIRFEVATISCCNLSGEAVLPSDVPAGLLARSDAMEVAGEIDPCKQ